MNEILYYIIKVFKYLNIYFIRRGEDVTVIRSSLSSFSHYGFPGE